MSTTFVLNDELREKSTGFDRCAGEIHPGKRKGI
jgi:hypothetical protein